MANKDKKIVKGFKFDAWMEFNAFARRILAEVHTNNVATFQVDDGPDDQKALAQLRAVSGEHFRVLPIFWGGDKPNRSSAWAVVSNQVKEIPSKKCHNCGSLIHKAA